jgi:MAF protein
VVLPGEAPAAYTLRVSREKAEVARARLGSGPLILSADTTVADGELILGKPADGAETAAMLKQLRGRVHQVYTAVTILDSQTGELLQDLAATEVVMRDYTDTEIAAYIASGDPLDKAGGYAIQNAAFHPVLAITGCYANVVGLPLCHLIRTLRRFRVIPEEDVPASCQQAHEIECPVYGEILGGQAGGRKRSYFL